MATQVRLDLARCSGHARCLEHAPDVFGFDDLENHAVLLTAQVGIERIDDVRRAADSCPERAIQVATTAPTELAGE